MWPVLVLLAACADSGRVELRIERPADPALDPFALEIGSLTLTAWSGGENLFSATRPFTDPSDPPRFGRVPIADGVRFELTAASPGGRVFGFARSTPVDVDAETVAAVDLRMRRPFVYIGGSDAVVAVDATREPGQGYTSLIDVGAETRAVAEVPGGGEIAVVAGSTLIFLSSATHQLSELPAIELASPAVRLAVSPDGRWVVATHADGVSIVDMEAVRAGAADPRFVDVEQPGDLYLTADLAWVISKPTDFFCSTKSDVVAVSLASGEVAGSSPLNTAASVIAADPESGVAFVTVCGNRVLRVEQPGGVAALHAEVPGPTSLDISHGRVWMMGHRDQASSAHLVLSSAPVEGGPSSTLELPVLEERAVATALDGNGQGGLVLMTADLSSAFDLDVLPDGEHVAILVAAGYTADASGDAGGGQPILPDITLVTYEYQLLELDTGLAAQRLRLKCDVTWTEGALLDDFACGRAPGQDEAAIEFLPTQLTALYGAD